MPQIVNTNIASLNAQRNLDATQSALNVALQRISSGLRINSAKDDAAGLPITDRMTAQIRGMNQAIRNANDAISLAQTGEGALQEITNGLQRMRELAVQSRNATNNQDDRVSLDSEFQNLLSEIDRIAQTTAFNGRKVLDGTLGTSVFQVGANVGETISVDVSSSMRTSAIGLQASRTLTLENTLDATAADTLTFDTDGDLVINGVNVNAQAVETAGRGQNSAFNVAKAINNLTDTHGVTATANTNTQTFTAVSIAAFGFDDATTNTGTYALTINGQSIFTQTEASATPKTAEQLATDINGFQQSTGVVATAQANGDLVLTAADGRNIEIQEVAAGTLDAGETVTGYFGNALVQGGNTTQIDYLKSTVSLTSSSNINLDVEATAADFLSDADLNPADPEITVQAAGIASANVLSETASDLAIGHIDQALTDVGTLRGTFGAIQSRFESTIASLQATAENVRAARSRIRDADFAAETAALTRAQILQQAGVAILAQANALPQNALALLQ